MAADRLAEAPTNLELTAIGGTHSSSLTQPHGDDQPFPNKARRTATQSTLEDNTIQGSGRVSDPVRRPKGPGKCEWSIEEGINSDVTIRDTNMQREQ
jgi:hypothetical protein